MAEEQIQETVENPEVSKATGEGKEEALLERARA